MSKGDVQLAQEFAERHPECVEDFVGGGVGQDPRKLAQNGWYSVHWSMFGVYARGWAHGRGVPFDADGESHG